MRIALRRYSVRDGVYVLQWWVCGLFFFFKQKTAYEMLRSLVGSEDVYKRQLNEVLGHVGLGVRTPTIRRRNSYESEVIESFLKINGPTSGTGSLHRDLIGWLFQATPRI
eukprot:TRINITY_DN22404_c0_g1_i3.p1 TRINITY_DN22404_c0_g1~~TRINITY_DN22404_c0_g1_i3.p1  ORF type:complete len:110 (+),score=15.42 TRINITY_DN22404_c0_g1_i3:59-388(+)